MISALPTYKLLLMGDSGTGKSSLLLRFTDDRFIGEDVQSATIGTPGSV
jgi:Ras-related protein Rab-18